jgi:hypothetical protein
MLGRCWRDAYVVADLIIGPGTQARCKLRRGYAAGCEAGLRPAGAIET